MNALNNLLNSRRRVFRVGASFIAIFFVLFLVYSFTELSFPSPYLESEIQPQHPPQQTSPSSPNSPTSSIDKPYIPGEHGQVLEESKPENENESVLGLPPDYTPPDTPAFCADRFTPTYLEKLRDSATEYCTPESPASITCFHSSTAGSRIDSFCFARGARFSADDNTYNVPCDLRDVHGLNVPKFPQFESYWYETGPALTIEQALTLTPPPKSPARDNTVPHRSPDDGPIDYTLLVRREGAQNIWHSLMEILSMTMSFDVLRMTPDPTTHTPLLRAPDFENTQVLVLDDKEEGPYFSLWSLFARRPLLRLSDPSTPSILSSSSSSSSFSSSSLIIPLSGGGNPLWQGDWELHTCPSSPLLATFSRRVLDYFSIPPSTRPSQPPQEPENQKPITVTWINRTATRQLLNADAHLEALRAAFPEHVTVQSVDFAAIPFPEQLAIVHDTDVLVGVHGAGLTHGIFLPERSAMVEILPVGFNHKGFRNVAMLMDHSYYSLHADEQVGKRKRDGDEWHWQNVVVKEERFMEVMDVAVKAVYNRGVRSYDTI